MIKRSIHRHVNNQCNTPYCNEEAKHHNKLYWLDPREVTNPYIHSATFCSDCFYRLTHDLPAWMNVMAEKTVSQFKHYRTLKQCNAEFISRILTQ